MKKKVLGELEAEDLLKSYGLPIAKSFLTKNLEESVKIAKRTNFPLVLKIISPKALHKTEIKGVRIITNLEELKSSYKQLIRISKNKKLKLNGILVQEFIEGKQIIIGIKNDPTFKHVIMLGFGGIYTEILRDITFRVCPITEEDASSMIDDLKTKKILLGFRNEKPVNLKLLKNILVKVSKIPQKEIGIEELDINPFVINDKIGKIVDARVIYKGG